MAAAEAATSAPSSEEAEQIQNKLFHLRKEQTQLLSKIADFQQERSEHRLVLEALDETEPKRRCYRMMGGVLVERTVEEVKPALKQHKEWVEELIEKLEKEVDKITQEIVQHTSRVEEHPEKDSGGTPSSSNA